MTDQVLKRSLLSAGLNIFFTILVRFLSFFLNAYILRCVTKEALGVNVRMVLLCDTVLFLARESFRKACLSRPKDDNWRGTVNLVWLSVPLGIGASLLLAYFWYRLELPQDHVDQYLQSVTIYCVGAVLLNFSEVFFIVGQVYLHVKFRSIVDFLYNILMAVMQCLVVTFRPDMTILWFSYIYLLNSVIYFLLNLVYYWWTLKQQASLKKKSDDYDDLTRIPFESIGEFFPRFEVGFDNERWQVSLSFFKQGFLKQLLTDGEKYVFTFFSLMSLGEQGIFDSVANLGSIPARLVFSKVEESSHLYFSQTVSRGKVENSEKEIAAAKYLHAVLKGLVLLSIIVCAFGMSYSHALLHLYGGDILSSGVGPALLRMQCFYVMFLAINGITECYAFCVMTHEQLSKYNFWMAAMTLAFLTSSFVFAKLFGPVGFVLANCCNFAMRISHNVRVILARSNENGNFKPLTGIFPSKVTLATLIVAGVLCQVSERTIYEQSLLLHIGLGACIFVTAIIITLWREKWLREGLQKTFKREKSS